MLQLDSDENNDLESLTPGDRVSRLRVHSEVIIVDILAKGRYKHYNRGS